MTAKSKIVSIGELIQAKIAAIDGASAAVFDLVPDFTLAQVTTLKIIVSPQSYARGNKGAASRENPDEIVKINIAVMKKCSAKTDIPGMLLLTEQIAKGIERQTVSDADTTGLVLSVDFEPIYDAGLFRQTKIFISVCTATVKVIR